MAMDERLQKRRESSKLRSAKHRARKKIQMENLKSTNQKLEKILEYLRKNAPNHWLAVQKILNQETTTEQQTTEWLVGKHSSLCASQFL